MRTDWQGFYLDGRTATRQPATIRLMREALEISPAGGASRLWPYRELRQTQGFYAGEEVRIERGDPLPETLLVANSAFLESLHEVAPQLGLRFHDPRRRAARLRWTIGAAGAVLAVTAAIYSGASRRWPHSWPRGCRWPGRRASAAPRSATWPRPTAAAAIRSSAPRWMRSCAASPRARRPRPTSIRVYVVRRPVVNAHALPRRQRRRSSPALLERPRTPAELAGVVAHELQHVAAAPHHPRGDPGRLHRAPADGADRRRDRPARLRAPDRAHAGRARYSPPRGGRGGHGGDEDAAGRPRRPGGDDRLLRHDPAGGGPPAARR